MNHSNSYQQTLSKRVNNLPALPSVLSQLNSLLTRDDVSIKAVVDLLKTDAALAIRLLRVVNSPFYGQQKPVENLTQAAVLTGVSEIANMARCLAMIDATSGMQAWQVLDSVNYWRCCLATSAIAKELAKQIELDFNTDLAACLHHIGICVLADSFPKEYPQVLAAKAILEQAEQAAFNFDNQQAKSLLLEYWNIAGENQLAIYTDRKEEVRSERIDDKTLVSLINAASAIAEVLGYSPCAKWSALQDPYRLLTAVGMDEETIDAKIDGLVQAASAGAYAAGKKSNQSGNGQATAEDVQFASIYLDIGRADLTRALQFFVCGLQASLVTEPEQADIIVAMNEATTESELQAVVNISECLFIREPITLELNSFADDGDALQALAINWSDIHCLTQQALSSFYQQQASKDVG